MMEASGLSKGSVIDMVKEFSVRKPSQLEAPLPFDPPRDLFPSVPVFGTLSED